MFVYYALSGLNFIFLIIIMMRLPCKTIGVIVPHINHSFFSDAIAGIEEVCFEHGHSLIICQSNESQQQENLAIETHIRQNIDCIFIYVSAETNSATHLEGIRNHDIELIQFDRYIDSFECNKVVNDNKQASFDAVELLLRTYSLLGGPDHVTILKEGKQGYLEAIEKAGIDLPTGFTIINALDKYPATKMSSQLLNTEEPPDAFLTVSDHQSLGVLQAAKNMSVKVPEELGIIGFANESFTELIAPSLSSINQHGKELGRSTANLYFKGLGNKADGGIINEPVVVKCDLIVRESSSRKQVKE